jgi:hypothetical protein
MTIDFCGRTGCGEGGDGHMPGRGRGLMDRQYVDSMNIH